MDSNDAGETSLILLAYHSVNRVTWRGKNAHLCVAPSQFAKQLKLLVSFGFQTCLPSDAAEETNNLKRVALTFDDGYEDFAVDALPLLKSYGFQAAVYPVTNQIGGNNKWDFEAGDIERPLLSINQLKYCHTAGIEIGSRTLDHVDLTQVSPSEAQRQIEASKAQL